MTRMPLSRCLLKFTRRQQQLRTQLAVSTMQEYFHGTQQKLTKKLTPAELFKNDELMPDVNVSLNEGRGEAKNSCEEEASGSTQVESKSPEKEIKALGSGDGKNRVVTTINLDGLINEIVIDHLRWSQISNGPTWQW